MFQHIISNITMLSRNETCGITNSNRRNIQHTRFYIIIQTKEHANNNVPARSPSELNASSGQSCAGQSDLVLMRSNMKKRCCFHHAQKTWLLSCSRVKTVRSLCGTLHPYDHCSLHWCNRICERKYFCTLTFYVFKDVIQ